MAYDFDTAKEADYKNHRQSFFLHPQSWSDNEPRVSTGLAWKRIKFTPGNKGKVPTGNGVYAFMIQPAFKHLPRTAYLFYVGKTHNGLNKRYRQYLDEKDGKGKPRRKVFKMLNMYKNFVFFYCAEVIDATVIDELENCLLDAFVPPANTTIPKAKVTPELKSIYEAN